MWINKQKIIKGVDKMFNPNQILEELKFITEKHGDKIFDEDNPEFYISDIYWCEHYNC